MTPTPPKTTVAAIPRDVIGGCGKAIKSEIAGHGRKLQEMGFPKLGKVVIGKKENQKISVGGEEERVFLVCCVES